MKRRWTVMVIGLVLMYSCSDARAAQTQLTLPQLNLDITTLTDGGVYTPLFPGDRTWNGVTFALAEDMGTGHNAWKKPGTPPESLEIPAGVYGVNKAYTIINTMWGQMGTTDGMVEFIGSDDGYYAVPLVQGMNIRDHFDGGYVNVIDNSSAVSAFYIGPSRARLDMQIYTLPGSFSDETLEIVRFTSGAESASGVPFLVAATVETGSVVIPAPGAILLGALGAGLVGWLRRRRTL